MEVYRRCVEFAQRLIKSVANIFIFGILFFTLISFSICLVVYIKLYPQIVSLLEFISIIPTLFIMYLIIKLFKYLQNKSEKQIIFIVITISTITYIILILSYNTIPVSDYKAIWQAACEMASNTFVGGLDKSNYMYFYNWQIGIAAFESLIIRIFGENFFIFKILNIILLNVTSFLIYYIIKNKVNKRVACLSYILTAFFLAYLLTVSQFSNSHLALVLILISFILIEKNKYKLSVFAGIALGFTNVIRAIAIVAILAIICYEVYLSIKNREVIKPIINTLCVLLFYSITINIFNNVFIKVGYADGPISIAKMPYFKYVKGLGGDQDVYYKLESVNFDYDKFNELQKIDLENLIKQPVQTSIFVTNKMIRFMGIFDYKLEHTFNHNQDILYSYPVKALYMMSWFQYIIYIVFAIIGYKKWRKEKDIDVYQIFFCGYILAHVFVEAFSSYRYEAYPFIIIMASYGISELIRKKIIL